MNVIFRRTKALVFFVLVILMTACLERQFEPEEKEMSPITEGTENGIPDDFDFKTTSSHELTVKVKDEYDGKYYYTVEVFNDNPIFNTASELICGAKANMNTPFKHTITIPKILKQVFIRLTDPMGYRYVTVLEITEGDLLFDYNQSMASKTKAASLKYKEFMPVDYDSFFKAGMSEAEEITKNTVLKSGKKYKITNSSFSEPVTFPDGKVTLYVGEGCKLILNKNDNSGNDKKGKNLLTANSELYVLKGAIVEGENKSVDLELDNGAKVFNAGTINLQNITTNGNTPNTEFYNHPGGKLTAKVWILNGIDVYNHCSIYVDDVLLSQDGAAGTNVYLFENSSLVSKKIGIGDGAPSQISMKAKTLLETNKFHKPGLSYLTISGEESNLSNSELPLIVVNEKIENVSSVMINWNVLLAAKGGMSNSSFGGVHYIDGKIPSSLQGGCIGVEYIPEPPVLQPEAIKPDYTIPDGVNILTYYYFFEDNWPGIGDYDMNDVVVNIGSMGNFVTGEVVAVGATKNLYLFAQADNTGEFIDLLDGQELHAFMGASAGEQVNSSKITHEPVGFTKVIDSEVDPSTLNVFIVWGNTSGKDRNEIHIAGFKGTSNAAKSSNSSSYYTLISDGDDRNLMWGLMIPKVKFSSYPKEGVSIMDAYPQFLDWAKSGGWIKELDSWYLGGDEKNLVKR